MKRQQDREISPRNKRSRTGYDHDVGRDRLTPDIDRREGRGGKVLASVAGGANRGGGGKAYRGYEHELEHGRKYRVSDSYAHNPRNEGSRSPEYRSLCISNIYSKIPDNVLEENLYREFSRYGDFYVKISFASDQRVAYVNFRYPEEAKVARHAKANMVLFDRSVRVDPVLNSRRRSDSPTTDFVRDRFANRSISPARSTGSRRSGRPASVGRDISRERDYMYTDIRHPTVDKMPAHQQRHPSPEEEEKATRTLFVGNLDHNITENELRRIFERYGVVEDIDIKRQQRSQGNPYAFIKFINLDCAHSAKMAMSGKHIGKFQCKIGYGKVTPTPCLWVGGLGPWINYDTLERELDRFGAIHNMVWPHGQSYAYVLYDNKDAAQAAFQEMRRHPFGEPDRCLRVDFAEPSHVPTGVSGGTTEEKFEAIEHIRNYTYNYNDQRRIDGYIDPHLENKPRTRDEWNAVDPDPINVFRNPDNPRDFEHRVRNDEGDQLSERSDRRKQSRTPDDYVENQKRFRSRSQERLDCYRNREPPDSRERDQRRQKFLQEREVENYNEKDHDTNSDKKCKQLTEKELSVAEHVNNLVDLAKCLPVAWNGALILKSSAFMARMHVVSGDVTIVDTLMRDPTTTEASVLRITQRLRLDQPKLEEVGRRVSSAGNHGHCILLALPSTLQNYEDPTGQIQQRPLRNLVTYLKQKEAAGVISLPPNPAKDKENVGVLHAFPPCQFGYNFLLGCAPKLPTEPIKEDYLVVIVVRGAT